MSTLFLTNLSKQTDANLNEQQTLAINGGIGPLGIAAGLAGSGFVLGGTFSTVNQLTETGSVDLGEAASAGLQGAGYALGAGAVTNALK